MSPARAIHFDAPRTLSMQSLEPRPGEAADLEVEVSTGAISRGSEPLLWDGTMPPCPDQPLYKQDLGSALASAFVREATLRIAMQWKTHDVLAETALVEHSVLSLEDLITHTFDPGRAREAYEVAFGDPQCLTTMIDWQD